MEIREDVLAERLGKRLSDNVQEIQEHVQGSHHKTFMATLGSGEQRFVRVHFPELKRFGAGISPKNKMPSEIATIKYIRKYTQIPAPDVLGYDADEDGGVGGEWMVMEYVRGTPLIMAWAAMSDDQRRQVTKHVADIWAQLLRLRFSHIGSLQEDGKGDFFVGPLTRLPSNNSRDIGPPDPSQCGPFDNPKEWLLAIAARQLDFSRDAPRSSEQLANIEELVEELRSNPELDEAGGMEISSIALQHIDMNVSNILVDDADPTRIVAVIDWEGARTVPLWAIQPRFFQHLQEASDEEVRDLQLLTCRAVGEREPLWLRAMGDEGQKLRRWLRGAEDSPWRFDEADYESIDRRLQGLIA
ncbi:hypothetical protein GLOTRDRAFT_132269 [Gloeophyllum trabeum ATCC 11539]|uniref:Aminoglycoside phosphotransferase domain-containing protein n=1 Tax=Gloeophyllum trabeum (strain ATCC 11539 / FP-39264 / Madison 617) TaxID=670483 RepID=S7PX03_GLOTA|nr:uncharacterized protein GLOTRDRAFT_132269 [Gloeophyllum trabeum ATCC 11539]EPQ52151.1 hypothetical protein GLOTRDRAFT_132269 [Gloeophyllum trabeum ATCC 11539]